MLVLVPRMILGALIGAVVGWIVGTLLTRVMMTIQNRRLAIKWSRQLRRDAKNQLRPLTDS